MLARLGDLVVRRPRLILAAAVVLAIVSAAAASGLADRLFPYGADDPSSESVRAAHELERATGERDGVGIVALVRTPHGVDRPAARAELTRVIRRLRADPAVGRVESLRTGPRNLFVSRDRRSTIAVARFRALDDRTLEHAGRRLEQAFSGDRSARLGGVGIALVELDQTTHKDLARAESIAFPLLFIGLLLVFRGVVAAFVPLLVGGLVVLAALAVLRVASEIGHVSVFALNLTTALGLGLAIDYSLFMVARFREELAAGADSAGAIRATLATTGRTVAFSSVTVAGALAALLVFPQRFLVSMGVGGVAVALVAGGVALAVLPALLVLLGPRINALAPARLRRSAEREARVDEQGRWYRLARTVTRRPVPFAVGSAALLLSLGIPFLGIRFTEVDASALPESASARQVDDAVRARFPQGTNASIHVSLHRRPDRNVRAYARRLDRIEGVDAVGPPRQVAPGLTEIDVSTRARAAGSEATSIVHAIRDGPAPAPAAVSGESAAFVDLGDSLLRHLAPAVAIVLVASLLLVGAMTQSVVLAFKALVMSALSMTAALGVLVVVYDRPLEATMPVLLLAVVLGLSTDYGVFLLARIKEAHDSGLDDADAVALGLERTGRLVTAAAALFCIAVGALASSRIEFIREMGVGIAVAVAIDATVVRAFLVPSLMALLGRANWWMPALFRRRPRRQFT